ncbi:PD-(D/E)XK nuclease superfamily protein [Ectothiorhodospira magna]|uniref:PD-(D/E)XK nuclease superfamily protein n=1 Tax=Ectothiorhodospira magna TaxID=867345 RepID=A0A1H9BIY7_9GAMM|nr:ATP-binding protein [Ectothiorhodospira magna]SEP88583.1 PD-(D/E)XK nuclease superfamily protein [Ectothiorhodospira magna]
MTEKRVLPIGVQAFDKIREGDFYYVDKTAHILRLVRDGSYYFLSRPRRFGKSLLIDTLRALFEGEEVLFRGLHVHDHWDWRVRHPVIRISFADGVLTTREALDARIRDQLHRHRHRLGLTLDRETDIPGEFSELIRQAHEHHGQRVVVLVDEYDKPILDNITDPERATALREGLKHFYSVLKDADPHLHFCLLTGVSKFSKVSLFSGLNNLNDITLDAPYGDICGYTDEDLDTVFAPELPGLDRDLIRRWYNGYRWGSQSTVSVYNPFDMLLLFQKRLFRPYWFESATPTFLVKLLAERGLYTPRLERMESHVSLLGQFDVDRIGTEALLFQTGYLTIHALEEPVPGYPLYTLGYPNLEVEASLNQALLPALGLDPSEAQRYQMNALRALKANDMAALETHLRALYAALPHDWYRNNPIARYEGHYASVFYSHLAALGLNIVVEDASNTGKVDMTVDFNGHIWLFEFKVVEQVPEGKALQQLKDRGYGDKYRGQGKPVHLVGVEFSRQQRQVVGFECESV